eukprot:gene4410-3209_t
MRMNRIGEGYTILIVFLLLIISHRHKRKIEQKQMGGELLKISPKRYAEI